MFALEAFSQHGPGAVEAGFDDAWVQVEDLGGLFDGEVFEVAENDDGAVVFGEVVDELGEEAAQLVVIGGLIGQGGAEGEEVFPVAGDLFEGHSRAGFEGVLAAAGEADIAGDAEYPGFDVFGLAQLVQVFADFHECFLSDFLGVFLAAAIEVAVLVDLGAEEFDEGIEGAGLARDHFSRQDHNRFHLSKLAAEG